MAKKIIIYCFISLLFAGLFYLLTSNLYLAIGIFAIYSMFFILYVVKKTKLYLLIIDNTKECVNFINNFIITISINNSVSTTFDSLSGGFSVELVEQINAINQLNDEEKVMYLNNYFRSPLYVAFTKLLKQYLYEGGNILDSSHLLIFDSHIVEENLNNYLSVSRKKIFEFCLMWGICFVILTVMKIFLGDYYKQMVKMSFFAISIFGFFIVFLFCFYLLLKHVFDLRFINEELKNEKIKK